MLMLSEKFFRSILSGSHVGLLKFKNGEELELTSKNVASHFPETKHFSVYLNGNRAVSNPKVTYDENWEIINSSFVMKEYGDGTSEYTVTYATFTDMAWIVEQVAKGNLRGDFYNTHGECMPANQDTVKLDDNFSTTRRFTLQTARAKSGSMLFTAPGAFPDICKHGQLSEYNIIDFIKEED